MAWKWLFLSLGCASASFGNDEFSDGYIGSDTWVATDGAGRTLPGREACPATRKDRIVGMFYWTWHIGWQGGPFDNTKILAGAKEGKVGWPAKQASHHWGEPELGYYLATDPFVIRKHASMLCDAGVDVIFFDTTNPPLTFKDQYMALCREYAAMRKEGQRTPAIAFVTPFGDPNPVLLKLWKELYEPGLYRELWFEWEGKPFILADPKQVKEAEVKKFFTFRKPMPDYWVGPSGKNQWSWLEVYPQHAFLNEAGEVEQMSVGVAQNALPNTPGPAPMSHAKGAMGRSWHGGKKENDPNAINLGLNFAEQWDRAIAVDPKVVFVTGWNEWIAGRYLSWSKYKDADCYLPGGLFVDEYTQEYSRDIEPMRGGHGDNYYYQLVANIRRYKGVSERPKANGPSAIGIDGGFEDWAKVTPEFRDTVGDVTHRDHPGYGELVYKNVTGRNDFVTLKAAYDDASVFFYAKTAGAISPRTDKHWMLLYIDADQNAKTGWNGYDFLVNLDVVSETQTTVKDWKDGGWQPAAQVAYRVKGNEMEIEIPRTLLGMKEKVAFDFHWADGIEKLDDISEFGVNGDSAPNRRFNYRYEVKK